MGFAKPLIPRALLHQMERITHGGGHDPNAGGQWVPGTPTVTSFRGVIMPLSNEDLQYMEPGTSTVNTQKLYTNSYTLTPGEQFRDLYDGKTYTITQELTHGPTHPLKRYMVTTKGVASK